MRLCVLPLPIVVLLSAVALPAQSEAQRPPLLQRAAAALGIGPGSPAFRVNGTFDPFGTPENWQVEFDDFGRWKESFEGEIPFAEGFDGHTCWQVDASGVPMRQTLDHRDLLLLESSVLSGMWASSDGPCQAWIASKGAYTVAIRPKNGAVIGELVLDPHTYLPITFHTNVGVDVDERFAAYKNFGGRVLPTDISAVVGGQPSHGTVTSAVRAGIRKEAFAKPPRGPQNTAWDAAHSPSVQSKFAFYNSVEKPGAYGQLAFIEPLIDGKDVGFFLLDSGSSGMALSPRIATALKLPEIGKFSIVGAGGSAGSRIYRAGSMRIGPMAFDGPIFAGFDGLDAGLAELSRNLGFKVAGICGFDLFTRASVMIDSLHRTVRLFKPGDAELPAGGHWSAIDFDDALPCLPCQFEGHPGFFALDTGAQTTITFHAWAVRRFGLLNRRSSPMDQTGAGGDVSEQTGELQSFNFAGNRVGDIQVGLATSATGAFAQPSVAGNIGMGLLGGYRIVFDYANERVGFGPR